jgi:hypothetical protein
MGMHDIGMSGVDMHRVDVPCIGMHNFPHRKKYIFYAHLRENASYFPLFVAESFFEDQKID